MKIYQKSYYFEDIFRLTKNFGNDNIKLKKYWDNENEKFTGII